MSAEEFVAWSAVRPERRCELERGEVVEMAAEQARHALMKAAAHRVLDDGSGPPVSIAWPFPMG